MSKSPKFLPLSSHSLDFLLIILGLAGLAFALMFYDRAFPSAALDLRLSRSEIAAQALASVETEGFDVATYKSTLHFAEAGDARFYLDTMLGAEKTNRLLRDEALPVWYWVGRWFRPLQKEEYSVGLMPDGTLIRWNHTVTEDAPGAALDQAKARDLALRYLVEDRQWDLTAWQEVFASSEERPGGRVDHAFEWRRRDWDIGDSELRISVTLQGDEVGYYEYWLKVPESFRREFSSKRIRAGFLTDVSSIGMVVVLAVGLAAALAQARGNLPLSAKRAGTAAALVGTVALLAQLNWWPLSDVGYSTVVDYTLFKLQQAFGSLLYALVIAASVLFLWMIAHWMAKQVWPLEDRILSRRGDRWANLARSTWRGLALAGLDFGYTTLFYFVATRILGAWAPMAPDYSNLYATLCPFMGAIEVGVLAAVMEEAVFRLMGISAVLWLTSRFTRLPRPWRVALAVLIPAALWGFAHSNYVRDPIYLRGIEVTVLGLVYGLVFMKFDLLTLIMAHYCYNAVSSAYPLLRSAEPTFVASGMIVLLTLVIPLLPWFVGVLRHRDRVKRPAPSVRPGVIEDSPALASLAADEESWRSWLANPDTVVLCLTAGDEIIGAAAGQLSGDSAQVLAIAVAPAWRRQYWGSEMLLHLSDTLKARGAAFLELTMPSQNRACRQFFVAHQWPVRARVLRANLGPVPPFSLKRAVGQALERWRCSRHRVQKPRG